MLISVPYMYISSSSGSHAPSHLALVYLKQRTVRVFLFIIQYFNTNQFYIAGVIVSSLDGALYISTGCPVAPHFPHFQNCVHIFKKIPHFPHFLDNPFWKMATAAFWLRNVSYEGSNWRSSFALSVKHGFYFPRTHSFSIEQQKATSNT